MKIGGLEKVVLNLMQAQRAGNIIEPTLFCMGSGGALIADVEGAGIPVEIFGKKLGLRPAVILRTAKLLRQHRIDVVHCHNWSGMVYGALGARLARIRAVVYTAHGAKTAADWRQGVFLRLGLLQRWIAVSEDARRVAVEHAGGSAQTVQAVINGVDLSLYEARGNRDRIRSELGIDSREYVFGIVARLTDAKDHIGLIEAFGRAFGNRDDVSLLIVGDGELRSQVERAAGASTSRIRIAGSRQDIPDVLAAMDVFVLSSHTEGLAITLLEAGAAGLPTVATDAGGNTEVVLDGETGLVVAPRDPDALSKAMTWIDTHREDAVRLGIAARNRVIENFSIESMARRYQEIYVDALQKK